MHMPITLKLYRPLSPRERQILYHVVQGNENKEIAHKLSISEQTVKNHMSMIMTKMGVRNRVQVAVLAIQTRLVGELDA